MKTTNQILTDFYKVVTANVDIQALNGGVYKKIRPTDSQLNDVVVSIITGISGKFLNDGALSVKIFYNDLFINNSWIEDMALGSQLEQILINISTTLLQLNGYSFEVQTREHYTARIDDENTHQHYAILKMNYLVTQN